MASGASGAGAGAGALCCCPPSGQCRAEYSRFDLLAGCATQFLSNACITAVTPVALLSAERRHAGSAAALFTSGATAGATSIGMVISLVLTYRCPPSYLDGRAPYYVLAAMLALGNGAYMAVELTLSPLWLLMCARVAMALGFGAVYVTKRRAAVVTNDAQRDYYFLLLELSSSLGLASGPLITGTFVALLPRAALLGPPLCLLAIVAAFVCAVACVPIGTPLVTAPLSAADPLERKPLMRRVATESSITDSDATRDATPALGSATLIESPAASVQPAVAPPVARKVGDGLAAVEGGAVDQVEASTVEPTTSESPCPVWVSASAVLACLLFGIGRNFLKFGFESAMVVVYERQFRFSVGVAGVLAGLCAMSGLVSVLVYKFYCAGRVSSTLLIKAAEALAIVAALLMIGSNQSFLLPIAGRRGLRVMQQALAAGASLLFYPSMYLGAALGNSRPVRFALPGHAFLSRDAIMVQQDLLQTTLGKGLGMVYCRQVLAGPGSVQLSNLGDVFLVVILSQALILTLGWDPLATSAAVSGMRRSRVWRSCCARAGYVAPPSEAAECRRAADEGL